MREMMRMLLRENFSRQFLNRVSAVLPLAVAFQKY